MFAKYSLHVQERASMGIPPLPLSPEQTQQVCDCLAQGMQTAPGSGFELTDLLGTRVPAGVAPAAKIKSAFLAGIALGHTSCKAISPALAVQMLGLMQGGYNIAPLLECLSVPSVADAAVRALSRCILVGDAPEKADVLRKQGCIPAEQLLHSWAKAEWFTSQPALPPELKLLVWRVDGEVNTDDLSPGKELPTRPDIPLHALCMGITRFPGGRAELARLRQDADATGYRPVFVADTLGTGSSRKSATNSLVWTLGDDIPGVPNIRRGGFVMASRLAPIFYNSFEDAGGLPLRADITSLKTGQKIRVVMDSKTGRGHILDDASGSEITEFSFAPSLADEWRAGGRINLIIGKKLTQRAAALLGCASPAVFAASAMVVPKPGQGYTLAQKLVGRACGKDGVLPGEYCEPAMSTVGSPDSTGPMTRDEIINLACLGFQAPLVMQSFCHTCAYPNEKDKQNHKTMPVFFQERSGVALRPGDGIVHSWLNRMLIPDRVGTAGDSHTRFPLGVSFPVGSGLVALAAAMGFIPLDMPESVLVRFKGALPRGITIRDAVNALALESINKGLMSRYSQGTTNVFNGRIIEMEGFPGLTAEEAFELCCATAERSASACTIALDIDKAADYVRSNAKLLETMITDGYQSADTLRKRREELDAWLRSPTLLRRDDTAEFAQILDLDLASIPEPIIACPPNPDNPALLSEKAGLSVDEVFIGSCMLNISHFRAAARILTAKGVLGVRRLWVTPPTRMDYDQLEKEGVLEQFRKLGARIEIPGCCLCMGNQARVNDNAVVFSTSTRNYNNRLGNGAQVYLGSGWLAAAVARLGRIPTVQEYMDMYEECIEPALDVICKPLYFHK